MSAMGIEKGDLQHTDCVLAEPTVKYTRVEIFSKDGSITPTK